MPYLQKHIYFKVNGIRRQATAAKIVNSNVYDLMPVYSQNFNAEF